MHKHKIGKTKVNFEEIRELGRRRKPFVDGSMHIHVKIYIKSYHDRDYDDVDERGWLNEWMDGKFCYHEMLLVFPFVFSSLLLSPPIHTVNACTSKCSEYTFSDDEPDWSPLSAFQIKNYVNFTSYKNTHHHRSLSDSTQSHK